MYKLSGGAMTMMAPSSYQLQQTRYSLKIVCNFPVAHHIASPTAP